MSMRSVNWRVLLLVGKLESVSQKTNISSITPVHEATESKLDLYATRPAAGFPAPGDDLVERPLDLNDLLISNPTSTFFVRVSGDSMEGAGIFDGDYLVVDRVVEPTQGKIVVAAVFGEMVVKRLSKHQSNAALVSENDNYEPILISEKEDVYIWGVVVGSARVFK